MFGLGHLEASTAERGSGGEVGNDLIASHPIRDFLLSCRTVGRAHIDSGMRDRLLAIAATLDRQVAPTDPRLAKARDLFCKFASIERAIYLDGQLSYSNYLNLPLLEDWIRRPVVAETLRRARLALAAIMADWTKSERAALNLALSGNPAHGFSRKDVVKRIDALSKSSQLLGVADLPVDLPRLDRWLPVESGWLDLVGIGDGLLGIIHLTGLPQSRFHDELMFVRITQAAECCFIGATEAITAAQNAPSRQALGMLKEASWFSSMLVQLFCCIFRTLPKENFYEGFRPETGGSSAIQSRNYQLFDVLVRGFGTRKRDVVKQDEAISDIALMPEAKEGVLAGIVSSAASEEIAVELDYHAKRISHFLATWRTFHLGIARDYLPPEASGTGGMGIDYLESTLREPDPISGALPIRSDRGLRITDEAQSILDGAHFYRIRLDMTSLDAPTRRAAIDALGALADDPRFRADLHDGRRIVGDLWLDVAVTGEFFDDATGRIRRCRKQELVVRDGKGIVASATAGTSRRTSCSVETASKVDIVLSFPPHLARSVIDETLSVVLATADLVGSPANVTSV